MSYLLRNEPAGNIDRSAAAPVNAADQRQADYYLRALTRISREIERRIGSYQAAMARYKASGDADYARWLRRQIRIEQRDRHILERMIDNLQRRFAPRDDDGAVSPRSRPHVKKLLPTCSSHVQPDQQATATDHDIIGTSRKRGCA